MTGVAYGANFIPLKATRPDGSTDDGMLAQAIQYAAYQARPGYQHQHRRIHPAPAGPQGGRRRCGTSGTA
jgi:hypothetical protein